jgi:anti-sigma factor RsiW
MKCWSEGDLRAFIDRELPPEEMDRVSAHLEECSDCGDHWAAIAGRSSRVSTLMAALTETEPVISTGRVPRHSRHSWRWVAVAAGIAAGLVIGMVAMPKRATEVALAPPQPPPVVQTQVTRPESPAPVVTLAASTPARLASARRPKRPAAPKPQIGDTFLALDNDPIEAGVVLRVALGPREVPADVIIDSDGRPRAIRLVNSKSDR